MGYIKTYESFLDIFRKNIEYTNFQLENQIWSFLDNDLEMANTLYNTIQKWDVDLEPEDGITKQTFIGVLKRHKKYDDQFKKYNFIEVVEGKDGISEYKFNISKFINGGYNSFFNGLDKSRRKELIEIIKKYYNFKKEEYISSHRGGYEIPGYERPGYKSPFVKDPVIDIKSVIKKVNN